MINILENTTITKKDDSLTYLANPPRLYSTGKEIKKALLEAFENAKKQIIIVVPWFTDDDIINILKKKKKDISIHIIISNEPSNIEKNYAPLKVVILDRFGYLDRNMLHSKFCIIDNEYVLSGSYNYTKTAYYNKEILTRFEGKKVIEDFNNFYLDLLNLNYSYNKK